MAFYVDARGTPAVSPREISHQRRAEVLNFALVGGGQEDVDSECVLPSGSEVVLVKPQQACVSDRTLNRIDAFFAKRTNDQRIDVHAEGQMMARIVMDPGCGWDCRVNPQPTIEDLYESIQMARQCNMRMLHLAGHAEEECGFIWNANDQATSSKSFDIEAISLAIGGVAGQQGPLECVVLNACCTLKMGRLLRRRGVPNVLCWQTPVNDETARELCERFFRPLVEEKQAGKRDYKAAFAAAMNFMRPLSHTHGAKDLPQTVGASASVGARGRQRGFVKTWQVEDVVLFLSNDGDSEPIYLWRERPVVNAPLTLNPKPSTLNPKP
jgi:hypothetical protein